MENLFHRVEYRVLGPIARTGMHLEGSMVPEKKFDLLLSFS